MVSAPAVSTFITIFSVWFAVTATGMVKDTRALTARRGSMIAAGFSEYASTAVPLPCTDKSSVVESGSPIATEEYTRQEKVTSTTPASVAVNIVFPVVSASPPTAVVNSSV